MTLTIDRLDKPELSELISIAIGPKLSKKDQVKFDKVMAASTIVWRATKDDRVLCIWGLVPPTLMDIMAYMWLHIIEPVEDYEFLLVRHSQRAIQKALEEFPCIVGQCDRKNPRAIRWVKWLGGTFGDHDGDMIPFTIKAKATNG
jgi:hypothetical protein